MVIVHDVYSAWCKRCIGEGRGETHAAPKPGSCKQAPNALLYSARRGPSRGAIRCGGCKFASPNPRTLIPHAFHLGSSARAPQLRAPWYSDTAERVASWGYVVMQYTNVEPAEDGPVASLVSPIVADNFEVRQRVFRA